MVLKAPNGLCVVSSTKDRKVNLKKTKRAGKKDRQKSDDVSQEWPHLTSKSTQRKHETSNTNFHNYSVQLEITTTTHVE